MVCASLVALFLSLCVGVAAIHANNADPKQPTPNKPHFSGMFFAMTPTVTLWTVDQWVVEFQYMKDAGLSFVLAELPGDRDCSCLRRR